MKKFNKILLVMALTCLMVAVFGACSKSKETESKKEDGKVKVMATIFPEYDFVRQIGKDHVDVSMLLSPGAESHSFEPTPKDIKNIEKADLFLYVGGDSDEWVGNILDSLKKDKLKIMTIMDCVQLVEEETVEGMTPEKEEAEEKESEEEEGPEYDEHVWTSPRNAKLIAQKICDQLCEIDPKNSEDYKANAKAYLAELDQLDQQFKTVVEQGKRKEIIVADRFPFRYFVEAYGLKYYAAFPGCSTDTEANASTVAFLTKKVKEDKIPVVFHIELSNEKMCQSIAENTGAKSKLLNAVHNISADDFKNGVTYMDLMKNNVEALKEALN